MLKSLMLSYSIALQCETVISQSLEKRKHKQIKQEDVSLHRLKTISPFVTQAKINLYF